MYQIRTFNGEEDIHADVHSTIHARATAERFAKQYGHPVQVFQSQPSMTQTVEWELSYTIGKDGKMC